MKLEVLGNAHAGMSGPRLPWEMNAPVVVLPARRDAEGRAARAGLHPLEDEEERDCHGVEL